MINIESLVFDTVADAVRTEFGSTNPDLVLYGERVPVSSQFPCITIVEDDNRSYQQSFDSTPGEHHSVLRYTVDIYTADASGRKTKARKIAVCIDNVMVGLGFNRLSTPPTDFDRSVFRMTMRYETIIGEGVTSGEGSSATTVYQTYRK